MDLLQTAADMLCDKGSGLKKAIHKNLAVKLQRINSMVVLWDSSSRLMNPEIIATAIIDWIDLNPSLKPYDEKRID